MALAGRSRSFALLVALVGCAPGAARGCATACRSSSRGFARSGAHGAEELARSLPRTAPRLGVRPPVVPGRIGGELGALGPHLDEAGAALPRVEGPVSPLAKVPSSSGAVMVGRPGARSLADDYARSIDSIGVTREQHVELLDLFDAAQQLADVVTPDTEPDDPANERVRTAVVAAKLDLQMKRVLDEAQLQRLHAALGTPEVMARRLLRERPMQRPEAGPAAPAP